MNVSLKERIPTDDLRETIFFKKHVMIMWRLELVPKLKFSHIHMKLTSILIKRKYPYNSFVVEF